MIEIFNNSDKVQEVNIAGLPFLKLAPHTSYPLKDEQRSLAEKFSWAKIIDRNVTFGSRPVIVETEESEIPDDFAVEDGVTLCACGCGEAVTEGRKYVDIKHYNKARKER